MRPNELPRRSGFPTPSIHLLAVLALAGSSRAQWGFNGSDIYSANTGEVGIGTNSPFDKLSVFATAHVSAITGVNSATTGVRYGGLLSSASTTGRGVFARAIAPTGTTYGVFAETFSPSGTGVFARAIAPTGTTYGVYAEAFSPSGTGVLGRVLVTGGATGVRGHTLGDGTGVSGTGGVGVEGYTSATSGGVGVQGMAGDVSSFGTVPPCGVRGWLLTNVFNGYGVMGWAVSPTPTNWGVYSLGRMGASGTKSFRIDHPADPANTYLYHYCAEGPEPLLIYRGTATMDQTGGAWVDLPDYFDLVNRDPHYQLTCIGAFAPVHVAQEVEANRFRIAGGTPGLRVSWTVTGVRDDPFVRQHGAPVVQPKPEGVRGKYQHPELYGQPPESAEMWQADTSRAIGR